MRFAITTEQRAFAEAVRELLAREYPAARVRAAWADDAPLVAWPHLARAGVLGMTAPERWGGLGLDELDLVGVLEEAGRAALAEPLLETTAVAIPLLAEAAPVALAERWVTAATAGRAAIAVELGGGLVADAGRAELLVLARDGEVHAIERAAARLERAPTVDRARPLWRVDWRASAATRLDASAEALALAFDRGALGAAAELVGLARWMLDTTVAYVQVRTQFGRPTGAFQAVKHHLAGAHVAIELAAPCVLRGAHAVARREPERAVHVSIAKARASDAAHGVARAALQCHGAIGYSFEHDLHLWMKRAWALAAAWGDAAWHRARVATSILGA